ncbi:uncharacterized protein [Coffea arabica]|uniref:Dentin sialophosphoprotein-like n=1 Tax=Coffea arabica TaxID=13443 RepID=A0ABM4UQF6_COFAR
MAVEMLEMVVKMRKIVIFTTKRCYRSFCSHPFLVGMLCFLLFLYRSSPFVFSLLVSASPVLVCTAVLLGTLLSFGQPNIPEIERDEKTNHEIASLRTGVFGDDVVVEKNESYNVEQFTDRRGDVVEQLNGVASSIANRASELHRGDGVDYGAPLIKARCQDIEFENRLVAEEGRKLRDEGFEEKNEINDDRPVDGNAKTDDEDLELENDKSPAESFDSERVNVDSLDSPPGSPWKHVEEGEEREEEEEEEEVEDDEALDSGSDRAESSSPDASMADIIPMLDELHPLLDEDAPQPVSLSHDVSDAASERSLRSSDSSSESDDDNDEKQEDAEAADEENDDGDDEDEVQGNREGQTKSAITWTEEDQKNLMDLGTSELERNQRLESLIARRRARKTMSMMAERNLIDLDGADLPFNVAPISTARNNPFDLAYDSYDDMGLPPIPGSAPSILLPRRNPFDLPYDSSEEKPDLMGDSFQQEFTSFQPKEPLFRRHESFNVGPSIFGPSRQERQDSRLRPYFVADRMDSDGAGYSSFQRQSSELSDSKASSVPETDSVASAGDIDEKSLVEENISHQAEALSSVPEVVLMDPAGDLDDKNLSEEDISQESDLISMKEYKSPTEEDISQEQEHISKIEHVSEHVGHGSQSSEETETLELDEIEHRDVEANGVKVGLLHVDSHHKVESLSIEEGSFSSSMELDQTETCSNAEAVKQVYQSTSNSSSLSDVSERISSEREVGGFSNLVEGCIDVGEEAGVSARPSEEGSDLNMARDTPQKEPVYDSSPPAVRKNCSSSSMSSDFHVETEMPTLSIKRPLSFTERESESGKEERDKNAYDDNDMSASVAFPVDENQRETWMATDTSGNHMIGVDLSGADEVSNSTSAPEAPEPHVKLACRDSKSFQDTAAKGDLTHQHGSEHQADNSFALVDADVHLVVQNVVHSTLESMATSCEDQKFVELDETPSLAVKPVLHANMPYTVGQSTEYHPEHSVGDDVHVEGKEKQIFAHDQFTAEEKPTTEYSEELVFLDKSSDETYSRANHEGQESAVIAEEIIEELRSRDNSNITSPHELVQEASTKINSPTSPVSISILSETYESRAAEAYSDIESNSVPNFGNDDRLQALEDINFAAEATISQVNVEDIENDADEIKEIDEVLLSELDAVGDFSIKELLTTSNEFEKHVGSVEEGFSISDDTIRRTSPLDGDSIKMHESISIPPVMNAWPSEEDDVAQYVEEIKCVSEPQTSVTNTTELANLSSGSSVEGVQIHIDSRSTEQEMLPRQNQIGLANPCTKQNAEEVMLDMPVIEAQSIQDVESSLKISELMSAEKVVMLGSTEIPPQSEANEASSSGMHVLEARMHLGAELTFEDTTLFGSWDHGLHEGSSPSEHKMDFPPSQLEDADLDLRQSNKIGVEREMLPDSVSDGLHEAEIKYLERKDSELSISETGSLKDPSLDLRQASEHQQDKVLESSALFEQNEAGTSRCLQSNTNELGVQEESNGADEKLDLNNVESPESLSTDLASNQEEKSHKSSTRSSSSSDSSSSDSDKE